MNTLKSALVIAALLAPSFAHAETIQTTNPVEMQKLLAATPELLAQLNAATLVWGDAKVTSVNIATRCRTWTKREMDPNSENTMAVTYKSCARAATATIEYTGEMLVGAPTAIKSDYTY